MASFIEKFYPKVFINVIVEQHYCHVYISVEKLGKSKEEAFKRFELEKGELTSEVPAFIESYERKSPFSYISVLNTGLEQGAAISCKSEILKDKVYNCIGTKRQEWSVYVEADALRNIQKKFKSSGVDYIFSPFSVIATSSRDIKQDKAQMFALVLEKSLSIAVFKNGALEFAKQYSLEEEDNEFDLEEDEDDLMLEDDMQEDDDIGTMDLNIDLDVEDDAADVIEDLDELDGLDDLDELDGLDDLDDLEDMDALGDDEAISDFADEDETENEESENEENLDEESELSMSGFSRNFKRFEMIQDAIHLFYHGVDVESAFIEDVYVIDPYDDCSDLQGYLEDELFVTVHFRPLNLHESMKALAKSEAKNAS